MRKLEEIEQDIEKLSKNDLSRFRQWFLEYDAGAWDDQFQADVEAGNLDKYAEEAIKDFRAGKAREL